MRPYLERAAALGWGAFGWADLLASCREEKSQMWVLAFTSDELEEAGEPPQVIGSAVSQIVQYPQKKAAVVRALGMEPGFLDWIPSVMAGFEGWALEEGCEVVEINGRAGWRKVLPEYAEAYRTFVKEIG